MCRGSTIERQRPPGFRIGTLHFGFHGGMGIASVVTTLAAIHRPDATVLLLLSQGCNYVLISHAPSLLPQVPKQTEILPGIVAPHKEAFRRTVSVMHYLITRVLLQKYVLLLQEEETYDPMLRRLQKWAALALLIWRWRPLIPTADWRNGNTWIFVVPMFVGISGDLLLYCLYENVFATYQLLYGQLLGLALAFGFTLGFRRYLPMSLVYTFAALAVWCMMQQGIAAVRAPT